MSIKSIASHEPEISSSEEAEIVVNPDDDIDHINFSNESVLNDISDLFSFFKEQINACFTSVLLHMSLRHLSHSWRDVETFLTSINGMAVKTSHKWANILINKDFDEFINDDRGGTRIDLFWDCYPDLSKTICY